MAIANNNLPAISLIVNVMTRRKASVPAMISKIDDAVAGVYAPRGYTEREGGARCWNSVGSNSGAVHQIYFRGHGYRPRWFQWSTSSRAQKAKKGSLIIFSHP
ncbi:hypothetical protein HGRIS_004978 [Hohenbuehelia grisea]|uniref:Uncharacterized protein n=1 Tax=Hohenbuehelia grisea TaxID=104357 RepID=A0ABR3JDK9_9AGAR